jgi:phosphoribosyl 1,2-cyclic phosphate phosphodiesterase
MNFKFTLLGTGSSMGVPRPDGFFGNCDPKNKKNYRTRCSALISVGNYNILIDTSPDLRQQLLAKKITSIDEVLFTHMHADQTHGINDLRVFFLKKKKKIPIHCDSMTSKYFYRNFAYCFNKKYDYPAILSLKKLKKNFSLGYGNNKVNIKAIEVRHGLISSIAYILNNKIAYVSDANELYQKDFKHFKELKYLIIDCLRIKEHPSHFNLDQVLSLVEKIKPKKTILTNMHSDLDYNQLLKILPNNILPGYDGLSVNI